MVEILAYAGGTSRNPYFASASGNPIARAAANGTLQSGPATNYGPATIISFGGNDITLAPATYSALGAGGGVITADQAYIRANSDVAAAVAEGRFRTGLEHYLLYGAREGRFYAGVGVQTLSAEQLYLEENPDVVNAVQSGVFRSGLEHYLLHGASEGRYYYGQSMRSITPDELYLRDNRDVANAVQAGVFSNGLDHFHKHGRAEGRFYYGHSQGPAQRIYVPTIQTSHNGAVVSLSPDQQYLSSNPAAAWAVASGLYRDGLQYFINEGYASGGSYRSLQGWRLNSPAERSYLKANPDVAEAVASGVLPSGEDHFFTYGKNEPFRTSYGQLTNAAYNADTLEGGYLRANRDAALALANGQYAAGLDYFLAVGAGRGQSYGKITAASLDPAGERQYFAANRDVANAVAAGQYYRSGLEHFLATGYAEGRNYGNLTGASLTVGPSATLDRAYLKAHPDAARALAAGQVDSVFSYFATLGASRGDSYGRLTAATLGDSNERAYLIRNKDVAAAVATGDYANGLDHFIFNGHAEGRGDYGNLRAESLTGPALGKLEAAYLQQNRDVARAVASGQFASGLAHFLTFGGSEGRRYGALQASQLSGSGLEAAYIVGNVDAAAAIATGQAASGLDYFLKTGIDRGQRYGRLSAAALGGVDDPERRYLTRYLDVAAAVAAGSFASGLIHYLSEGKAEGRIYEGKAGSDLRPVPLDPAARDSWYLVSNEAAYRAVATGAAKSGLDYFLTVGIDKGDTYGRLDRARLGDAGSLERQYLSRNLDVAAAVAEGVYANGVAHYLTWGYKEGRQAYGRLGEDSLLKGETGEAEAHYLLAHADVLESVLKGRIASGFEEWRTSGLRNGRSYGGISRDTLLVAITQDAARYVNAQPALAAYANGKSLTSSVTTELAIQHFAMTGFEHGENLFGFSKDQVNKLASDINKPGEIINLPLFGTLGLNLGAFPGAIVKVLDGDPRELFALIFTLATTDGYNCGEGYNDGTRSDGSQPPDTVRAVGPFDRQCNQHDAVYEEALGNKTKGNIGKIKEAKNRIEEAEKEINKLKSGGTSKFGMSYWQNEIASNKAIIAEQEAKVRAADVTLAWIAIKDILINLGQSIYAPVEAVYKLAAAMLFTAKAGVSLGVMILEHLRDHALEVASKLWEGVTGVVKDFWTLASDAVSRFVGAVGDFFSGVGKTLETIAETVGTIFDHIGQAIDGFFGGRQTPDAGEQTPDVGGQIQDADGQTPDVGGQIQDADGQTQDAGEQTQDAGEQTQDVGGQIQDADEQTQDAGEQTQDAGEQTQDADGQTQDADDHASGTDDHASDDDE